MSASDFEGARVRWLVAGSILPSPGIRRFLITPDSIEQVGRVASRLSVTVQDRIGAGDASSYQPTLDSLSVFHLREVVDSIPELRTLRAAHDALSNARALSPEESARLQSALGPGRLSSAIAEALRRGRPGQDARRVTLAVLEEVLFATARDILQHPWIARLESAWRGLQWLVTHCPTSAGLDIDVLDIGSEPLVDALARCLDVSPLQRPDACFLLDEIDDIQLLRQLATLGELSSVPMVAAVSPPVLGDDQRSEGGLAASRREAWRRLRADEASRWLCAAVNPVLMLAERHGPITRECFTSPTLAVAAMLSASFRDTHTFARVVGPGSGTRAPAVWRPRSGATVATEVGLSLREQERLAAQGILGVTGWWGSDAVLLAAAPSLYGGRDAVPLPGQILTGRLVRMAQEITERLPTSASDVEVTAVFSRAAEVFLPTRPGPACQLEGRLVPTGRGHRSIRVRAALQPELAGTRVQLELAMPLRQP